MCRARNVNVFGNLNGSGAERVGFSRHAVTLLLLQAVLRCNTQIKPVNMAGEMTPSAFVLHFYLSCLGW